MNLYRGKSSREVYLASLLYDSIDDNNFSAVNLLLCEKEADPNLILPTKSISSFHLAIGCDDETFALKVTRLILQNRGDPNVSSDDGLTPVHIAAAWGRVEILKMLLNCGGDCEYRDTNWMTPIHYAIKESYQDCLNLLESYLPYKYDILYKDKGDSCQYKLYKIIINNGYARGEYELYPQIENSINPLASMSNLASLPKSDTTKYVLKWFETHIDSRGGQTFIKNRNSLGDTSSEDDKRLTYESSFDESENENDSKRSLTTFKKLYKKKIKVNNEKQKIVTKKLEFDETVASSGFNSAESDIKKVSSESRILTLNSKESNKLSEIFINPDNFNTNNIEIEKFSSKFVSPCKKSTSNNSAHFETVNKNSNSLLESVNSGSEYLTCSTSSLSALNKNIFAITGASNVFSDESCVDNNKVDCDEVVSTDMSFLTVSEFYKYEDKDEGITLYEKRIIKISSDGGESVKTFSTKMSSLPETFEYDAESLRRELRLCGYEPPGPITASTKRVYLNKLFRLKKQPLPDIKRPPQSDIKKQPQPDIKKPPQPRCNRVYSPELEKTLRDTTWKNDLTQYRQLEEVIVKEFSSPLPSRKWREGHSKTSFTYLLLDPRKTDDLPCRALTMDPQDVWKTFLSAIFYIGKGKKTRPYSHLYEAVSLWKKNTRSGAKKKLDTILDIWQSGAGVICLHVFQNIIPVEAYTREATMINALKMENLSNEKNGEYYGTASTWRGSQKRLLGTYLLYKAMTVFLTEGERPLYATDISNV